MESGRATARLQFSFVSFVYDLITPYPERGLIPTPGGTVQPRAGSALTSPLGAAASPHLPLPPPLPAPFCIGADCPARQRGEVRAVPSQSRLPQYGGTQ